MVCVLGAAEGCMLATFPMAKPFVILAGSLLAVSLLAVSHALKLELASVLFRHGDRSPTHTFPNDRYQESYWPQGFGQLSAEPGMRQEYFLGEVLRNRYVEELEIIHPNYTRVQVYVRSTDYDRTLMSAESVLAALFPPKGDQIFNDTLPWQPIPVHTLPVEDDNMLHAYSNCPVYEKLLQEDKESQSYRDLNNENEGLKEDTGYESFNLDNVHSLYGTLYIEEIYKLNLSSWVTPTVMGRLRNLTVYTGSLLFNSVTKNRLTAGNWVGKVVSDMKTRVGDPDSAVRLYLYSAHDTTVAAMMTALGVFNGLPVPYAATFIIELYSDSSRGEIDYWVSLYYRNDSDGWWPLHINSCENTALCSLQEFIDVTAPCVPSDWEKECGLGSQESGNGTMSHTAVVAVLGGMLGLSLLLLLVAVVTCVGCMVWSKRQPHRYSRLLNSKDS